MIPRETIIEQSITDHLTGHLQLLGYDEDILLIREAFPGVDERSQPLLKTTLATGFNFDDGGRMVELGSDLTMRIYTIEFWCFATTPAMGRNVANVVKEIFELHNVVPLHDYGDPAQPIIDHIVLLQDRGVQVQRQIATDPRAWDVNVFTTTVKFEDFYSPSAEAV